MNNMDNNTAQNNGLSYPNLSQNGTATQPSSSPAPVNPVSDDARILNDLANQLKEIQNADSQPERTLPKEQVIETPTPVINTPPVQPESALEIPQIKPEEPILEPPVPVINTSPVQPEPALEIPQIKPEEPIIKPPIPVIDEQPKFELPTQAVPAPTNIMTEDSIGIVRSTLSDIMPGEKVPRALQRTPKEKNLSQPFKAKESFNTVRKDIFEKQQSLKKEEILDETPKNLGGIDELLKYAVEKGASDLHISVGYPLSSG